MILRHMRVTRGGLEIAMPQQHLNAAQIDTGFQQVRRIAVPQRVRADSPRDARTLGSTRNDPVCRPRFHRPIRIAVLRKQPDPGPPRPPLPPVIAQHRQQVHRELDHPVLVPLATANVDEHAPAVDVTRHQMQRLADPQPRPIQRHHQRLVLGMMPHDLQQSPHLIH